MAGAAGRQRGFSLLELVAVVLIVGIVLAVVGPRIDGGGGVRELGFVEQLLSDLRLAQRRALADGCEVRVALSSSGYSIEQRASLCSGAFNRAVARTGESGSSLGGTAPSGLALAGSPAVFYFDSSGAAVANVGGSPVNAAISVGSRQIQIVGTTGYAAL